MFGALPYLEWRIARNQFRALLRSPWRLLAWVLYAAYLGGMIYLRAHPRSHASPAPSMLSRELATTIAGVALLMTGATILTSTGNGVRIFRSKADALLLPRAGVGGRDLVLWLQLRTIVGRAWYFVGFVLFYVVGIAPNGASQLGWTTLLTVLVSLSTATLGLPIYLASITGLRTAIRTFGGCTLAAGFVFAIAVGAQWLAHQHALPAAVTATANAYLAHVTLAPGDVIRGALGGSPALYLALVAVIIIATLAAYALAADVYPELTEASFRLFDVVERARRGEAKVARATTSTRVPAGAAILLWKSALVFSRSPSAKILFAVSVLVALILGTLLGFVLQDPDPQGLIVTAGMPLLLLAVVGFASTFSLAADVSKPYWWLTGGSLFERLVYWTIGETRYAAAAFGIGVLIETIVGGLGIVAALATISACALWWSTYAVGTLVFIVLPGQIDRRGPGMMLRFITGWIPLLILVGFYGAAFALGHNVAIAFVVMTSAAIAMGLGALALAAERLAYGGGATFARAAAEQS